jgi:hypothetical protein
MTFVQFTKFLLQRREGSSQHISFLINVILRRRKKHLEIKRTSEKKVPKKHKFRADEESDFFM